MSEPDPESLARAYYEAIDAGDYEHLSGLLAPEFTQVRGDRTIEGRDAFVRFMREERPETDTTHEVDAVYRSGDDKREAERVVAQGRLHRADGSVWFGFVDVFEVDGGSLVGLSTYSNARIQ